MKRVVPALIVVLATLAAAVAVWRVRPPARASLSTPPRPSARGGAGGDGRTAAERAALRAAETPERHAATLADAEESPERDDYERLYQGYEPYFVRGDLNGDGLLDFAQAFVSTRDPRLFDVAVFFGESSGGFRGPLLVEKGVALAAGDLAVERSLLILTPDLSAEASRRYRFDEAAGGFVDVDASPDGDAGADEGPDGKPRLRA